MALKLKGSTSGFVGLDAPSVAGNNTLILPENSGSAFQVFANDITAGVTTFTTVTVNRNGDLTVPGTISIGGTLTYEDVTSVDSVGIVTARGLSIFGNTTGLNATGVSTFTDDVTFTGAAANIIFDKSDNALEIADDAKVTFGTGADCTFTHSGSDFAITEATGNLNLKLTSSGNIHLRHNNESMLRAIANDTVEIYYNDNKRLHTTPSGVDVTGTLNVTGVSTHTGLAQFANTINLTHASAGQNYIYFNEDLQFAKNGTGTRLKIDSSGKVNIGNTGSSWVGPLSIGSGASGQGQVLQIYSNSDTYGAIFFGDADSGAGRYVGSINYYHDNNYMRFDTAGAERLRIDSSGINVSGIVTAQAFVPTAQGRFPRNIIINGGALVAQRAGDATEVQVDGYGSVDRFALRYSGTDEAPVQLQSQPSVSDSGDNPYKAGLTRAFHVRNGNQTSGAGSADYMVIQQRLEAADLRNSGWDYTNPNSFVTLSYYVKSNVAQNFYVTLKTNDGTPQKYAMETGSLSVQTWKRVTHKIPGNSNLQFDENTDEGLEIEWSLFRGTDQTGSMSLNAWAAQNNSVRTPDQTSTWYTTDNSNFELTGVQLELGPAATPFEIKSFADELRSCQRYCFRIGGGSAETGTTLAMGVQSHSNLCKSYIQFPTTTRSKDMTFTFSELSLDDDVAGYAANRINSVNSESSGKNAASLIFNTDTMGTVRVTRVVADAVGGYIQGECEL